MPAPLLELRGVTKRFPGVLALSGVSLEIYPGEIVALIGENGAGKSTLLKTLGGVHQPDEGTIQIDGKPVTIRDVNDAMAFGIGFIHQELNVLDNVDVAGNIYLGREPVMGGPLRLIDRRKIHADADRYMKRLGISNIPTTTRVGDLPIAYQQMVEIAKALSMNTRILLMDEPTSSLTLSETETLLKITQDLRAEGVSIIYISHRLSEVIQIADRVVALRDGKNAGGLSKEQITHDNMVKLMVGRDIAFRTPAATKPGDTVLEVKDLRTQRYPKQAVSFSLKRGEVVGFAGLVGAGRSEVAQAIFGVDRPVGGQIVMNGKALPSGPRAAIGEGIYLVPEDRRRTGLVTTMTIRENTTLPAMGRYSNGGLINFGRELSESKRLSGELRVKCSSVEQLVKNLSGGNQQKVVLAKWMALAPKLLIFDEPTRGIDVGAKAEIYDLMRKLAESGVAVMMISSDMEEVLGESQRVVVMHEGSIAGFLDRSECNEEAIMRLAVGHHEAPAQ